MSFVHVHSPSRGKLNLRAVKCIIVGYSSIQKGYKYYHPPSKIFIILADVNFHESESYFFSLLSLEGEFNQGRQGSRFLFPF